MKAGAVALLCVVLAASQASGELYGYSISASSTDPWVNQAEAQTGLYEVYVWLSCVPQQGADLGEFVIAGSLADRYVGWENIPPIETFNFGPLHLVWYNFGGPCLHENHLLMKLWIYDPAGMGGGLCFNTEFEPFPAIYDCPPDLQTRYPAAVVGFANDGTAPCEVGFCEGPVSVEGDSWGKVKSLYR